MEQETIQQEDLTRLDKKEIARRIREEIKQRFPLCKFSVTRPHYSNICVALMESNFKVIKDFKDISDLALFNAKNRFYSSEQIKEIQSQKYHQLNNNMDETYKPDNWNNGVFLTEKGFNLLKEVVKITWKYNYDNSDLMSDYFDVNFYLNLSLGKWDKNFIDGVEG